MEVRCSMEFQLYPSVSKVPSNPSCGYFSSSRMCKQSRHMQQPAEQPHRLSDYGVNTVILEEPKWMQQKRLVPRKKHQTQTNHTFLGSLQSLGPARIEDLRDAGLGLTPTSPFNLPILDCAEKRWLLEDENRLSCTSPGVTAILAAFPDVGSLLAQINISLVPGLQLLISAIFISSQYLLVKITRSSFLSVCKLAIYFQCSTSGLYHSPFPHHNLIHRGLHHLSCPKDITLIYYIYDILLIGPSQ